MQENEQDAQRTDVFYGTNLKTMAVALYNIGVMSNERIKEMLNAINQMEPPIIIVMGIIR